MLQTSAWNAGRSMPKGQKQENKHLSASEKPTSGFFTFLAFLGKIGLSECNLVAKNPSEEQLGKMNEVYFKDKNT